MKVYIAGVFREADRVDMAAGLLQDAGFTVTVDWWSQGDRLKINDCPDGVWYDLPPVKEICGRDLKGIEAADFLLYMAPIDGKGGRGANFEMGYALAKGKTVIIVGPADRCALYWPCRRCETLAEAIDFMVGKIT